MNQTKEVIYRIAELDVWLSYPAVLEQHDILPSFKPFLVKGCKDSERACSITLSPEAAPGNEKTKKLLSEHEVLGQHFRFYEQGDCYLTTIMSDVTHSTWKMLSAKNFGKSVIYIPDSTALSSAALSWLIMVAFGQACLSYGTILVHASVVSWQGKAYAFLGKSGTGKSTHSQLWLENIEGAELLNDDNPAVRLGEDGNVYVYGSPWSGKTDCYKNKRIPLLAFIRLKQANVNRISFKNNKEALVSILPGCTAIRWDKQLFARMTDTALAFAKSLAVAELECLPNRDAALLCHREITKIA